MTNSRFGGLPVLPGALHSGGGGQEQESAPQVVATETVGTAGREPGDVIADVAALVRPAQEA